MTTFVGLLRGVNVGGRSITMASLRDLVGSVGGRDPETVLNSGNVVFDHGGPARDLDRRLERAALDQLQLTTSVLLRTAREWPAILRQNPMQREARDDPGHLLIVFLKSPARGDRVAELQSQIRGRERVRVAGRQLFVAYPDGIGRSPLTLERIERAVGTQGTARNWNTALRIQGVLGGRRARG